MQNNHPAAITRFSPKGPTVLRASATTAGRAADRLDKTFLSSVKYKMVAPTGGSEDERRKPTHRYPRFWPVGGRVADAGAGRRAGGPGPGRLRAKACVSASGTCRRAAGNPFTGRSVPSTFCLGCDLDPLVRIGEDGAPEPRLATCLGAGRFDETRWRFTLRDGVVFSNGAPFDADNGGPPCSKLT